MGQDPLSTAVRYGAPHCIPVRVGDLSMVDHDGVPLRPVALGPADALAELQPAVRGEDLATSSVHRPGLADVSVPC